MRLVAQALEIRDRPESEEKKKPYRQTYHKDMYGSEGHERPFPGLRRAKGPVTVKRLEIKKQPVEEYKK